MAVTYTIHPETPQKRTIEQIKEALQSGAVMLYPTDTVYAIGCSLNSKSGIERVRQIKNLSNEKPLTFLCPSLSNIAQYAQVTDSAYRIMKRLIPGPYTFLLPTTKLVPKLVLNPKRRTTGIRVPDNAICQALLEALETPIISTSARPVPEDEDMPEPDDSDIISRAELFDSLERIVDIIVDDGLEPSYQVSTILDMTGDEPVVVRRGRGWEALSGWIVGAV